MIIWLHLVAATVWIGGMLFLSLVLAPMLRDHTQQLSIQAFFRAAAQRFRVFARVSMVVLVLTGVMLLDQRLMFSVPLKDWPFVFLVKLALVALLIGISLFHEIVLGPKVGIIRGMPDEQRTSLQRVLLNVSPWISRLTLFLGLGVLYVASILARI